MGTRPSKAICINPSRTAEPATAQSCSQGVFIHKTNVRSVYTLKHVVGSGFFGNVRLAVRSGEDSGTQYAIKSISKEKATNCRLLERELQTLHQVDHPNIVRLYEVYEDDLHIHLVMELCTGGELFDRIEQKQRFSEEAAAKLMHKVLHAVSHLHALKISHRDLKAEHILFTSESEDSEVKIIDFGLAIKYSEDDPMTSMVGTPYYVAPEVLNKSYGPECDVWSLGVILYFLLSGFPPFNGKTRNDIYRKILIGEFSYRDPVWASVSEQAKDLINKMLCKDPKCRVTVSEAMEHPWFHTMNPSKPADLKALNRVARFKKTCALREEILSLVPRYLHVEELHHLNQVFRVIDRDHKGNISVAELQDAMYKLLPKQEVLRLFEQIGSSKAERLNYSDFLRVAMSRRILLDNNVRWMIFKFFDLDNTGLVTARNIRAALESLEVKATPAEVLGRIREAGLTQDAPLDFAEFCKLLEPLPEELSSDEDTQEPESIITVLT